MQLIAVRQHGLFGPDAGAEISPAPAVRRRGRGATPVRRFVVTLPEPNPAGRHRLTFAYRPLRGSSERQLDTVHELLTLYFRAIGGFRIARDATMRLWCEALGGGVYSAQELRWAIAAKAASLASDDPAERREKSAYRCSPERFITFASYWIEQSPEYQADVDRQRRANQERQRAAVAKVRAAEHRDDLDRLAAGLQERREAREQVRQAAEVRRAGFWAGLTEGQRSAALAAVRPRFTERCREWGENPGAATLAPVLIDMAVNWAILRWPPDADGPVGPVRVETAAGLCLDSRSKGLLAALE